MSDSYLLKVQGFRVKNQQVQEFTPKLWSVELELGDIVPVCFKGFLLRKLASIFGLLGSYLTSRDSISFISANLDDRNSLIIPEDTIHSGLLAGWYIVYGYSFETKEVGVGFVRFKG